MAVWHLLDSVNAFILRLVGCHAALTDWGCFFRERCCGEETHNMSCQFVIKVLFWFRYLLHCTTHHQFICTVGKQSGIYKAMYSEPVHPSVFTDATGTPVTQENCSCSPQTSQNLHNDSTHLLKCDKCNDRLLVPTVNRFMSLKLGFTSGYSSRFIESMLLRHLEFC